MIGPGEAELRISGSGNAPSKARLRENLVYREAGPWSATVLALLRHLENEGFPGAPRVIGGGFAADGRELLSFIPGESPQPDAWSDDGAAAVGQLLRAVHEATSTFVVPSDAVWRPWWGRDLGGSHRVVGHCDTGPWNFIARDGVPVVLIDWEFAGPVDAVWELAQAAWLNAQLHDDDVAEKNGLPSPEQRARQVGLILDGYELPRNQRADFVDRMIAFAVQSAGAEAIQFGVTEETTSGVDDVGYPFVWGITWRVRSASWMLRHRKLLEEAVL